METKSLDRRDLPNSEFETRLTRAQAIMREHQLDGLVVTTSFDFRYFSGLDMQFWESPTRPWFLVVPATGEPIAIVPEIGAREIQSNTWLSDVRSWPAPCPEDDGITLLSDVIKSLSKRFGRVGMELGREMALRMPVIDFLDLKKTLIGNVEIIDGSQILWRIRMIKTEAEIDRIREICRISSDAYDALVYKLSPGMTERDAARALRIDINARGADSTIFLPAISGPGGVPQIVCGPTDRELKEGDVLFLDTGSTFDGYFCDFDRNYAVGKISDEAKRAQETVWQATEAGIKAAVPGVTTDDLWEKMNLVLEAGGSKSSNVGRLGHGLGLQLTEPPSHMPGDGTILEPGMVLTIEPGIEYSPGKMIVHEENIVIRESHPELLSTRAPREMPIIK